MKYQIQMVQRNVKLVGVEAESAHAAVMAAAAAFPEFRAEEVCEMIADTEEPGQETEGDVFGVDGWCESCGEPILTGEASVLLEDAEVCLGCAGDRTEGPDRTD